MRLSRFFLPILKENPKEAEIVSHRLMLRAGMIRQEAAGIYAWLPLGFRVLKKIEQIPGPTPANRLVTRTAAKKSTNGAPVPVKGISQTLRANAVATVATASR